jgi:hypothetical protein
MAQERRLLREGQLTKYCTRTKARAKKGFTRRGGLFTRDLHVLHVTSVCTCIARSHFTRNQ